MIELIDVLKKEYELGDQYHICLKKFNNLKNRKARNRCYCMGLHRGGTHNICHLKYCAPDHILITFHNLRNCDTDLFIKELGKKFSRDDIEVIAENKEK